LLAPDLGEAEEEALLGGEAVDRPLRPAGELLLERRVGDPQTAVVGDVLAQGQAAVDLDVVDRGVARVLVGNAARPLLELRGVGVHSPRSKGRPILPRRRARSNSRARAALPRASRRSTRTLR